MIPYGRQDISQADVDAVLAVLQSDFLTQGPAVPAFEAVVASAARAAHAVAVNSATSALHIACLALELGPGDVLWTVPNTFVASANCARYCGADVDFVDIDSRTWNMSVAGLRQRLEAARETGGRLPKIVVPVHFGGQPTDAEAIWSLSQEYGFKVIEDASHSIGASHKGEPVGSCKWSHVTIFSFHPVKIVTSGEGGMVMTNDAGLAEAMRMLRSHGITRDASRFQSTPDGRSAPIWYYEQQTLGYNYRLTDIHAALGMSQMQRLSENVEKRNRLAARYGEAFHDLPISCPHVESVNRSSFHLYVFCVRERGAMHRRVFDALRADGIGANLHYFPVHLQPYYRALGFRSGQFPAAEAFGATAITIPLYAHLTDKDQGVVIEAVRRAVS